MIWETVINNVLVFLLQRTVIENKTLLQIELAMENDKNTHKITVL